MATGGTFLVRLTPIFKRLVGGFSVTLAAREVSVGPSSCCALRFRFVAIFLAGAGVAEGAGAANVGCETPWCHAE